MIFNFLMGVGGLLLAGDSLGKGLRNTKLTIVALGILELIAGLYFITAAIGAAA